MYDNISSNIWRTRFLFVFFFIFIIILGWILGLIFDVGYFGTIIAFMIFIGMVVVSYFFSDSIVLSISGAREVQKHEFPYLYNVIDGLAIAAGIPSPKKYVIDSPALNAFATGRNPEKASVCITTGLLQKLDRQELEGVIGHEMAHIKNYDMRLMTIAAVLVGVIALISDIALRSLFWGRGSRDRDSKATLLLLVIGIPALILSPLIAQVIKMAISREREYLADASSAVLTRNPDGLVRALEKISGDKNVLKSASKATAHLFISNPLRQQKSFLNNMFSTHPPLEKRIARLREL